MAMEGLVIESVVEPVVVVVARGQPGRETRRRARPFEFARSRTGQGTLTSLRG